MRRGRLLTILVVTLFPASGCVSDSARLVEANPFSRLKPRPPAASPDVVELRYIAIERDLGNDLIKSRIWEDTDEQAISMDLKQLLNSNGLRIGKIGSRLSPEMLKLLERANDTAQGRLHHGPSGTTAKIDMTPVLPQWNLFTVADGAPKGETLSDAQGYLQLTPTIGPESTVHLAIAPRIEYGPRIERRGPAPDLTGFQFRQDRAARAFPELKVELSVASGDYILIGCDEERKGTLGWHMFTRASDGVAKQSVLLVRIVRPSREELYAAGFDLDDFFLKPIPQTARRRFRSSVRETMLADRQR
jgi:hypothetical protein